jgi:hypothetical protein
MDKMPEHYGGANEKLMEVTVSGATRIMEKGSCSSWVVEMEKMLDIYDTNPKVVSARWSRHSIYRVPQFMKDMTICEAYSPRFACHWAPCIMASPSPAHGGAQAPGGGAHG